MAIDRHLGASPIISATSEETYNLVHRWVITAWRVLRGWWSRLSRSWMCRPLRWVGTQLLLTLRRPGRLLVTGWAVALLFLGSARSAAADGLFTHPTYADAQQTLFERYGPFSYPLTVLPDDDATSGFGLTAMFYQIVGFISLLLLWLALMPLYGALTLLEWFLNLTVYRDSASEIDAAVQSMAAQVFWPLIGATVAVGATIAYAKWRGDGQNPLGELAWVIAAATLAVVFVNRPSDVMSEIDSVRQQLASAVVTGASSYTQPAGASAAGYLNPQLAGPDIQVSARNLVNGLWESYAVTPWCLVQFHELSICQQAGSHVLAGDQQWQDWTAVLADNGQVGVFGQWQNWLRGMDYGRLGVILVMIGIDLPAAVVLAVLVFAGLSAVVGLLGTILLAVLTLVCWPIPGWFRRFGTGWWAWVLGFELLSLFITAILAAVMVVSHILGAKVGQYGFLITGLLNLALLFWALKARSWVEAMTTLGGGGSSGMTGYLMMWGASKAGRALTGTARRALRGAGHALGWGGRQLANSPHVLNAFRTPTRASTPGMVPQQHIATRIPALDTGRLLPAGPTPRQLGPGPRDSPSSGGHPGPGPSGGPSGGGGGGGRGGGGDGWRRPRPGRPGGSPKPSPPPGTDGTGHSAHRQGSPRPDSGAVVDAASSPPTPRRRSSTEVDPSRPTVRPTPHTTTDATSLPQRRGVGSSRRRRQAPLDGGPSTPGM